MVTFIGGRIRLEYHASAGAAGVNVASVTVPGTVIPGDVLVLMDFYSRAGGGITPGVPSGFSSISSTSNTSGSVVDVTLTSIRIATSGDAGRSLSGHSAAATFFASKLLLVFRGNRPVTAVNVVPAGTGSGFAPAAQQIDATAAQCPAVAVAFYSKNLASYTRAFTISSDAKDGEQYASASNYLMAGAYRIMNKNSRRGLITVAMSGESFMSHMQSFLVEAE